MLRLTLAFSVLLILVSSALAQFAPPPAKELDRLKPFAGHWKGTGTASMGPEPTKWTSEATYAFVLGGHFLLGDMTIRFEGMDGVELRFRELMGWDAENKRYVTITVGNGGEVTMVPMHFVGEDQVVSVQTRVRGGMPEIERSLTKFSKDESRFTMTMMGVDNASHDVVTGTMKRADKVDVTPIAKVGLFGVPSPAEEMKKLAGMVGKFDLKGEWTPAPGAPAMKISGRDTISAIFGGSVLMIETKGSAEGSDGSYEALGFYSWNADAGCYDHFFASNMAEVGKAEMRFADDDHCVITLTGLRQGTPMAARGVLTLKGGKPISIVNTSCVGTADAQKDFTGTYTEAR